MAALVVYDSKYGNTERLALVIADALGASARRASEVASTELAGCELLVVGSPTWGGRPTPAVREFVRGIPAGSLRGAQVAAFDTRLDPPGRAQRLMLRFVGHAAGRIAKALRRSGGRPAAAPAGFIVAGTEGPLGAGEEERALRWARGMAVVVARQR